MAESTSLSKQNLREYLGLSVLYGGFFVIVFVISAYLTFPYDRLRDFIVSQVEASGKGRADTMLLEIGELQPSMLTGAVLHDVELRRRTSDPEAEPSALHFDELSARVSPWSIVTRSPKVMIQAKIGEGELDGSFAQEGDGQVIDVELDAIDVGKLGLGSFLGVPLKGRATGAVDLTLPAEAQKSTGTLDLKIAGLKIGDGKAKLSLPGLRSGMTLEEVDAGTLDLSIKAQNGVAEISKFATNGKDLKINGEGSIRLANPLRRSRPDVQLELMLSDTYKNKTDRTKALFEILAMQPDWQRATGPDGSLNLHVAGTLQAPRATPGGTRKSKR